MIVFVRGIVPITRQVLRVSALAGATTTKTIVTITNVCGGESAWNGAMSARFRTSALTIVPASIVVTTTKTTSSRTTEFFPKCNTAGSVS